MKVTPKGYNERKMPKPGMAHLLVVGRSHDASKLSEKITFQILAHEDPEQEIGETFVGFFHCNPEKGGYSRIFDLCIACGLTTAEEVLDAADNEDGFDLPVEELEGKQFLAPLIKSTYNGQPRVDLKFNFYAMDSEEAKDYPINPQYYGDEKQSEKKSTKQLENKPSKPVKVEAPEEDSEKDDDEVPF